MPPPEPGRPWTRRRVLLVAVAVTAVPAGAATGCGIDLGAVRRDDVPPPQPPEPGPDDLARVSAVRSATTLRDAATAALAVRPDLGELLARVAGDHGAHLGQLGPADPAEPTTPGGAGTAAEPPPDVASLAVAEAAAATEVLVAVHGLSGPLARLLTSVAASRVAHSVELAAAAGTDAPGAPVTPFGAGGTLDSPGGPRDVAPDDAAAAGAGAALLALVEAEHAAAYAYGVLAVRLVDDPRAAAVAAIDRHQRAATRLVDLAVLVGVQAPPADAAYATPPVPDTAAATALAADVELGIASAAAALVAESEADLRQLAADVVVARVLASRAWRSPLPALPGLPEHAG